MAKILLVEDDNNLREIFAMRLQAEGYEVSTASDGEEALAVAVKQKPDLIVADVMMPRLSGFEMLENLRAAPEMKDTKVVMMTALGQAEDRTRGEKLGVVKYLVKSQVTLEDFVRVVREIIKPNDQNDQAKRSNMNPDDNKPADPAMPGAMPAGDAGGSNPISGDPAGAAQPAAEEKQDMDEQADAAAGSMGGPAPAAPAEPAAGGAAPAGGDDAAKTDGAL